MKSIFTTLLLFSICVFSFAQTKSLSEQLWERAEPCNNALEDMDEDGDKDYEELIDDSKNGYLKISGSFPTCGCECSSTVGAFKTAAGEYVFLDKTTWSCGWTHEISSNRDLNSILPLGIGKEIMGYNPKEWFGEAHFYYDLEIPQFGTKTKLTVKIIPIGLSISSDGLPFSPFYKEQDHVENYAVYNIPDIVKKLDNETIKMLVNGDFDLLSEKDNTILDAYIRKNDYDSGRFASLDEISEVLNKIKDIHRMYSKLKYTSFTLDWDKKDERFYIKSKDESPEEVSFEEFLENVTYWMPIC